MRRFDDNPLLPKTTSQAGAPLFPKNQPAPAPAFPEAQQNLVAHSSQVSRHAAQIIQQFLNADYLTATFDINAPGMADVYDSVVVPQWSSLFGHFIVSELLVTPRPAHAQVLDVGCGTGYPAIELARYLGNDMDITGIDIWESGVESARRKAQEQWLRSVVFLPVDIAHAQFPENSFDIITSNLGYGSFADHGRSIAVMTRLLRENGTIICTAALQTTFREFLDLYHEVLTDLALTSYAEALVNSIKNRPTIAAMRAAFQQTGLQIVHEAAENTTIEFADARDFFTSPVIALQYIIGWRGVITDIHLRKIIFAELERRLDAKAKEENGLKFTVSIGMISAQSM